MTDIIPFNKWSRERIKQGRKFATSRKRKYDDPRVLFRVHLPWGIIKEYFWKSEGADSPEELQKEINKIFGRDMGNHESFWLHIGDFREVLK